MTTDRLLTPTEVWSAKIYSNGWKRPGLGTADVTEKATGAKIGEIGNGSRRGRRFPLTRSDLHDHGPS